MGTAIGETEPTEAASHLGGRGVSLKRRFHGITPAGWSRSVLRCWRSLRSLSLSSPAAVIRTYQCATSARSTCASVTCGQLTFPSSDRTAATSGAIQGHWSSTSWRSLPESLDTRPGRRSSVVRYCKARRSHGWRNSHGRGAVYRSSHSLSSAWGWSTRQWVHGSCLTHGIRTSSFPSSLSSSFRHFCSLRAGRRSCRARRSSARSSFKRISVTRRSSPPQFWSRPRSWSAIYAAGRHQDSSGEVRSFCPVGWRWSSGFRRCLTRFCIGLATSPTSVTTSLQPAMLNLRSASAMRSN